MTTTKPTIRESLLTDEDIHLIKKRRNISLIFIIGTTLLMDVMCAIMYFSNKDADALVITGVILTAIFALVIWFLFKDSEKDFTTGTKFIITGIVIEKKLSGGKTKEYKIIFENETVKVTWKQYKEIKPGDKVEIHYTHHSKISLAMRKLI
ncbi:MAG: hypothetical protein A2275_18970 [Bacteroidetes bacterium RIFOXYA12_FULL_35_11]|nr:MAG: hypothetical protein A2X01_02335 [Bacteroidetes bacterium GWF2_35_48]OFY74468.1 MAG: hypothetical protein A2275_18970 [Bacteroidetes bacterium RIFOXYA12_FULL_35_11]OFY93910.1 MAG: hypothetical protein A2309_02650 [Bacteroidetes bacterium RIFOXYB2_FULL_35_7]OFY96515.1 MAG: hypothetical protein A2491_11735 [Bacteroidetes bacterium RIFOXYC12_FULL_35_7]HBX49731.1 hypothetical protein [Bacteroidales bacterium]